MNAHDVRPLYRAGLAGVVVGGLVLGRLTVARTAPV
jgi:hypothetical protein